MRYPITLTNPIESLESLNKKIAEVREKKKECFENGKLLKEMEDRLVAIKIENMVRGGILAVALLCLSACGGGGGSDTPNNDCQALCSHATLAFADCNLISEEEENQFNEDCYQATVDINRPQSSCARDNQFFYTASCQQIADAYLRRTKSTEEISVKVGAENNV